MGIIRPAGIIKTRNGIAKVQALKQITEEQLQQQVFELFRIAAKTDPRYELIFAVPNQRAGMMAGLRMKAQGQKKGVSDIVIACPAGKHHGAFLELKRKGGKASPEQIEWIKRTAERGYYSLIIETDNPLEVFNVVKTYFLL